MLTNETKSSELSPATEVLQRINLAKLLGDGEMTEMARAAGVSVPNVSKALRKKRPGNPFVIEAIRRAKESGAWEAQLALLSAEPTC